MIQTLLDIERKIEAACDNVSQALEVVREARRDLELQERRERRWAERDARMAAERSTSRQQEESHSGY